MQLGAVLPQPVLLAVAVDAGLRGRNRGLGRDLDRRVAVAAVRAEIAGVQRMAVGNGLHGLIADGGSVGRGPVSDQEDHVQRHEQRGEQDQPAELVRPAWKNEETDASLLTRVPNKSMIGARVA